MNYKLSMGNLENENQMLKYWMRYLISQQTVGQDQFIHIAQLLELKYNKIFQVCFSFCHLYAFQDNVVS